MSADEDVMVFRCTRYRDCVRFIFLEVRGLRSTFALALRCSAGSGANGVLKAKVLTNRRVRLGVGGEVATGVDRSVAGM